MRSRTLWSTTSRSDWWYLTPWAPRPSDQSRCYYMTPIATYDSKRCSCAFQRSHACVSGRTTSTCGTSCATDLTTCITLSPRVNDLSNETMGWCSLLLAASSWWMGFSESISPRWLCAGIQSCSARNTIYSTLLPMSIYVEHQGVLPERNNQCYESARE